MHTESFSALLSVMINHVNVLNKIFTDELLEESHVTNHLNATVHRLQSKCYTKIFY